MANLRSLSNPLDELMNGFFVRPMNFESRDTERPAGFRMDVYENENAYRVIADLPGVRKDDINVTIEGGQVAVTAEARREPRQENEKEQSLLTERFNGKYFRSLSLGHDIDEANAQARYVDGVLELILPKSPDSMPKKISIQ